MCALFPQAAGYDTAMLGKWHLGHFRHAHLPRARGFDDFIGFYSGFQDYFTHVRAANACSIIRRNLKSHLLFRWF